MSVRLLWSTAILSTLACGFGWACQNDTDIDYHSVAMGESRVRFVVPDGYLVNDQYLTSAAAGTEIDGVESVALVRASDAGTIELTVTISDETIPLAFTPEDKSGEEARAHLQDVELRAGRTIEVSELTKDDGRSALIIVSRNALGELNQQAYLWFASSGLFVAVHAESIVNGSALPADDQRKLFDVVVSTMTVDD